ncbi:MAG TPA: hypothetical protein VF121_07125 [Thermoanaerobaculia bacterium]|nr:hypothetical protein [Thermoanaerobaculia bacterium]
MLGLAVALAAAAFYTARQEPVFRATTTLAVVPVSEVEGTEDILRSLDTLERRTVVATFAKVPGTAETRRAAARALALRERALRAYRLRGSVLPNTNIIQLQAEGPDARTAAALANAAAEATRREARSMYRIYTMRTLEEARPPGRPVYPTPRRNYVVAAVLGLFVGAIGALLLARWRTPTVGATGF